MGYRRSSVWGIEFSGLRCTPSELGKCLVANIPQCDVARHRNIDHEDLGVGVSAADADVVQAQGSHTIPESQSWTLTPKAL